MTPKTSPTLLFFAGPSGGHLFPALAVAEALKQRHPEARCVLVTSERGRRFLGVFSDSGFDEVVYLPNFPFLSGNILSRAVFLVKLAAAFWKSSRLLAKIRPDVCLGFGSYVSFPGMLLAAWRGIPTVLHEQNCVPGRATRWLAPRMKTVLVSFETTFSGGTLRDLRKVGLPLRSELRRAADEGRADVPFPGKFCVFVMGGSQGARALNRKVCDALSGLSDEEKREIAVIHITGNADYSWVSEAYQKLEMLHEIRPFADPIHEWYRRADMAITRAGANTLFELALFRCPALVVPYPHAGNHQAVNASYFQEQRAVEVCPEADLTAESIRRLVLDWKRAPQKLLAYRRCLEPLTDGQAAVRVADIAEELLGREKAQWELSGTI